ncbi:tetratricopeptide repeat protein [Acidithiobacillus caldus]|jgi:TPR repeat protein|uniref:Sel1 domain protein repeat-containing protein n=3 Tax=Acidithiobacillus caldus TaxID=33059 RepID=F9ZMC2_ACICS|nr:Sel1 domain protein repeat-containing protein [Acidithiobacillus caldus SM-1]AIA54480.1 hypothetical protein Acaty_c0596 [Acidithiobacillus caldus ATCC 51756]QER45851.1 hypothetical protein F0726_02800 [Acidithiobacillus caldus]
MGVSQHRKRWMHRCLGLGAGVLLAAASSTAWAQVPVARGEVEDNASTQPANLTTAKLENSIGTRCALGEGVPQDYALAAQWFRKAAEHGYGKAEYNLGMQYYFGQGVPQDYAQAAYWWERAANQNISAAQYNLGNLYFMGQGVARDYQKASYWWQKAAANGNADATRNLAVLARMEPAVLHPGPVAGPVAASVAPQG